MPMTGGGGMPRGFGMLGGMAMPGGDGGRTPAAIMQNMMLMQFNAMQQMMHDMAGGSGQMMGGGGGHGVANAVGGRVGGRDALLDYTKDQFNATLHR
jgi:hypothetical protein